MTVDTGLDTGALDAVVGELRANAGAWVELPLAEKVALLERLRPRIMAESEALVAETQRQKGIDPASPWGAEDWLSGPWAFLQGVGALLTALHRVENGEPPLPLSAARRRRDGRTVVDVFPANNLDKLLLSGYRAEVWMQDGVSPAEAVDRAAAM